MSFILLQFYITHKTVFDVTSPSKNNPYIHTKGSLEIYFFALINFTPLFHDSLLFKSAQMAKLTVWRPRDITQTQI